MTIQKTPSIKLDTLIPLFMKLDKVQLSLFVKTYYEWMEEEGPTYHQRRIIEYSDIDLTTEYFINFIKNEFLIDLDTLPELDQRRLIKNIKDFYRAKGSELSYRLLFRILFNEEIDFYYPSKDILRASDGRWVIEKSLLVDLFTDVDATTEILIIGQTSGAVAKFERILKYTENQIQINEIFITYVSGTFVPGEMIKDKYTGDVFGRIKSNGVKIYSGSWKGTNGFLSADKFLQDNNYYQEFSYVVKSTVPSNYYRDVVNKYVHPSGTKMFGQIVIEADANFIQSAFDSFVNLNLENTIYPYENFSTHIVSTPDDSYSVGYTGKLTFVYDYNLFWRPYEDVVEIVWDNTSVVPFSIHNTDYILDFENKIVADYIDFNMTKPNFVNDPYFDGAVVGVVGAGGSLPNGVSVNLYDSLNVVSRWFDGTNHWIKLNWQYTNDDSVIEDPKITFAKTISDGDYWESKITANVQIVSSSTYISTGITTPSSFVEVTSGNQLITSGDYVPYGEEIELSLSTTEGIWPGGSFNVNLWLSSPSLYKNINDNVVNSPKILHFDNSITGKFEPNDLISINGPKRSYLRIGEQVSNTVMRITTDFKHKYIKDADYTYFQGVVGTLEYEGMDVEYEGSAIEFNTRDQDFAVMAMNSVNPAEAGLGTISITSGSNFVIGTGTEFTSEFSVGDVIEILDTDNGINTYMVVRSIFSDTKLLLRDTYAHNATNVTYIHHTI